LLGDSILPADLITYAGTTHPPEVDANASNCVVRPEPCNELARNVSKVGNLAENTTSVELPRGVWYSFNTTRAVVGGWRAVRRDVPLDEVVVYVRAGAVLALQRDVIQHTAEAGGVLQLQLYAGASGSSYELVEDDGNSTAYEVRTASADDTRTTVFRWDGSRVLTWACAGGFPGRYTHVEFEMFAPNASSRVRAAVRSLGASGKVDFAPPQ